MTNPARIARRRLPGALGGVAGTVAMSAWMIASERIGLMPGQPPRMAVDRVLPRLDERTADRLALLAHAGYGAAAGAALSLVTGRRHVGRITGAGYGLLPWAAGYEGWVPMLGVLPPAHDDHRGRVTAMVVAHVVFGVVPARVLRSIRP